MSRYKVFYQNNLKLVKPCVHFLQSVYIPTDLVFFHHKEKKTTNNDTHTKKSEKKKSNTLQLDLQTAKSTNFRKCRDKLHHLREVYVVPCLTAINRIKLLQNIPTNHIHLGL